MDYEYIEHTADIGLLAKGRNLESLFDSAARGMFSYITPIDELNDLKSKRVVVKSNDYEELLVDWLNELNYLFQTERLLFKKFNINIDKKNMVLKAKCFGEKYDSSRHQLLREIKAATFSDLKIKKSNCGYKATIIFDV